MKNTEKIFQQLKANPIAVEPLGLGGMLEDSGKFFLPDFQPSDWVEVLNEFGKVICTNGIISGISWENGQYKYQVTGVYKTIPTYFANNGITKVKEMHDSALISTYQGISENLIQEDMAQARGSMYDYYVGKYRVGNYVIFEGIPPKFGKRYGFIPKVYQIVLPPNTNYKVEYAPDYELPLKYAFLDNKGEMSIQASELFQIDVSPVTGKRAIVIPDKVAKLLLQTAMHFDKLSTQLNLLAK